MSMYAMLTRVTEDDIDRIGALRPDEVEGFLGTIRKTNPAMFHDLDKAWHGLHYLLTHSAWESDLPSGFIMSGEPIEGHDAGYGPGRILTPDEVEAVSLHLWKLDDGDLAASYDPPDMMALSIYPTVWDEDLEEGDNLGWLIAAFHPMRRWIESASLSKCGIVVSIY